MAKENNIKGNQKSSAIIEALLLLNISAVVEPITSETQTLNAVNSGSKEDELVPVIQSELFAEAQIEKAAETSLEPMQQHTYSECTTDKSFDVSKSPLIQEAIVPVLEESLQKKPSSRFSVSARKKWAIEPVHVKTDESQILLSPRLTTTGRKSLGMFTREQPRVSSFTVPDKEKTRDENQPEVFGKENLTLVVEKQEDESAALGAKDDNKKSSVDSKVLKRARERTTTSTTFLSSGFSVDHHSNYSACFPHHLFLLLLYFNLCMSVYYSIKYFLLFV